MNKKEINEIRKQFTPNNCTITRMCGCYVDGEKNKKTEQNYAYLYYNNSCQFFDDYMIKSMNKKHAAGKTLREYYQYEEEQRWIRIVYIM